MTFGSMQRPDWKVLGDCKWHTHLLFVHVCTHVALEVQLVASCLPVPPWIWCTYNIMPQHNVQAGVPPSKV